MNTNGNNISDLGQLSTISYFDYGTSLFQGQVLQGVFVVEGENFSLNSSYTIIDFADTDTGMQAMLLAKNDSAGNAIGEYVIAFRGTETDSWLDIAADGLTGLINYNPQVSDARDFVQAMMTTHNIAAANLSLTGHSLGGIITQAVGADLHIQGYAYNPYGANLLSSLPAMPMRYYAILGQVLDIFDMGAQNDPWVKDNLLTISFQDNGEINGDVLSNLATQFGELIAGNNHIGGVLPIFGDNVGLGSGHSMNVMNVAVQNYNEILSYFTHATTMSDLSLIYTLEGEDGFNRVEQIFTELNITAAPEQSLSFEAFGILDSGGNVVAESSSNISALVNTGIAYRYALLNLNSFTVLGDEILYDSFNQQGELDLYNTETGVGGMTQSYINDRALMLEHLIISNIENDDTPESIHKIAFNDYDSNISFFTDELLLDTGPRDKYYFGDGNENFLTGEIGEEGEDHLYGMGGNDTLLGQEGDDYLEGGSGSDTLTGGKGNDILSGGAGADTYIFNTGDGVDIIIDEIHAGDTILINGFNLGALRFTETSPDSGMYVDAEFNANVATPTIRLQTQFGELFIISNFNNEENFIKVNIFTEGDFGVNLQVIEPQELPELADEIYTITVNDLADYSSRQSNADQVAVNQMSIRYDANSFYSRQDYSANTRRFDGGDNNDVLVGSALPVVNGLNEPGNLIYEDLQLVVGDYLIAGNGDDVVWADGVENHDTGDADIVVGGLGSDVIYGGQNLDILFAQNQALRASYDPNRVYENEGDSDYLNGGGGDDYLYGGSYDDDLDGEDGDDFISAGSGNDMASGGDGEDQIFGDSFYSYILTINSSGIDFINDQSDRYSVDFSYDDILSGGAGDDDIYGELGSDIIDGGDDNDRIVGDRMNHAEFISGDLSDDGYYQVLDASLHGNDYLFGGAGDDEIYGNAGDDHLVGGSGNDILQGDDAYLEGVHHGDDVIFGDEGNDDIEGNGGGDVIYGGAGSDNIWGDSDGEIDYFNNTQLPLVASHHGDDEIYGEQVNDFINAGGGNDYVSGGDGNDTLYGDSVGNSSRDIYVGQNGHGMAVPDEIRLNSQHHGDDTLDGDSGDDIIYAGEGNDRLIGGLGDDALFADAGDDFLEGGADIDILLGGEGDDVLVGGTESDFLSGGNGADTYMFKSGDGTDLIEDTSGASRLVFQGGVVASDLDVEFGVTVNNEEVVHIRYGNDVITLDALSYVYISEFEFSDGEVLSKEQFIRDVLGSVSNYVQPDQTSLLTIPASYDASDVNISARNNDVTVNFGFSSNGSTGGSVSRVLSSTLSTTNSPYSHVAIVPDGQGGYSNASAVRIVNVFNSDGTSAVMGIGQESNGRVDIVQTINNPSVHRESYGTEGNDRLVTGETGLPRLC